MFKNKMILGVLAWLVLITSLHGYMNVNWVAITNEYLPVEKRRFNVAYIPVTCHLACPVTDYISKFSRGGEIFLPRMFQGFPEIKEALIANKIQAAFMVAPMAMVLKSQGVPIRIVYLGHRYGSAVVVRKDGPIKTISDLRGKKIAIPTRYSDERLMVYRAAKSAGLSTQDYKMVEMAPPDVAGALSARAIDGFSMGEPFPSQAEMGGYGRVLVQARDIWPDYMSCVLAVRQDMIDARPDAVQILVDGIARSGLWLEAGKVNKDAAADFVGRFYYNQKPGLLRWALTNPLGRVTYDRLEPRKPDFDMVRDLMIETGLLTRKIEFEEYIDTRFADKASIQTAWKYTPASSVAE